MVDVIKPQNFPEKHLYDLLKTNLIESEIQWKIFQNTDHLNQQTLYDVQVQNLLSTLDHLGLSLSVLNDLNLQNAIVVPVKHVEHYKGGHYCVMCDEGIHTETSERITIYYHCERKHWFARPAEMFKGFLPNTKKLRFFKRIMAPLISSEILIEYLNEKI